MKSKRNHYQDFSDVISERQTSLSKQANATTAIYYGRCVDNRDPKDQGRIKIYIPKIDHKYRNEQDRLPWCEPFFTSKIQYIPKPGETVAIILEDQWKKNVGRKWMGPVFGNRNISIPLESVALTARPGNTIELTDDGNLILTRDSANDDRRREASLTITEEEARTIAENIILDSRVADDSREEYALPYGERLVELLRFILSAMLSHSHPPNTPPTPEEWTRTAIEYRAKLDDWLLNKNVRTRGE